MLLALKLITIALDMSAKTPVSRIDPGKLLFGSYRGRLLGLLFMQPDRAFHLREIERSTGVPSGPAHRELKNLAAAGLLSSERVGNQVRYRANPASPIFAEVQGIVRKTVGLADVLREALGPLASRIHKAFLFGSIARGDHGPRSDVDLMVVGEAAYEDVIGAVFPLAERLGREVNPVVLTRDEFESRVQDAGFTQRVMSGPRIPLFGGMDDA